MCLQCAKKLTAAQMSHAKSSISTFQKHSFWKFNFPIILRDLQTCFEIGEGNTHVSWCKKLIRKVSFQLFYVKVAPKCADLWWYQSDKSETRKEIFWNGVHCRKSEFSGTGKIHWQIYLILIWYWVKFVGKDTLQIVWSKKWKPTFVKRTKFSAGSFYPNGRLFRPGWKSFGAQTFAVKKSWH